MNVLPSKPIRHSFVVPPASEKGMLKVNCELSGEEVTRVVQAVDKHSAHLSGEQ
jgi:hypothetical protein